MDNQTSIRSVFAIIIFLLIALGSSSLFYLNTIASEAEKLYRHPYTVSNAAKNININLISMHRYMKDVAFSKNNTQLLAAETLVDKYEMQAQQNFDIIFERYLGDRKDIQSLYDSFIEWKKIRDHILFLKHDGKDKEALTLSQNQESEYVALLTQKTEKLVNFADQKAKLFFNNAIETRNNAISIIITLFIITVLASTFIAYYSLRRLRKAQLEIKSRMFLIDQNILMAKFDLKGVVIDISNKLCRFLGQKKQDLIGQKLDFFISKDNQCLHIEEVLNIISTGTPWEGEIFIKNTHNGTSKWIHSSIHPDLNEQYEVQGYSNIIQDISDKKAVEKLSITDPLTKLNNRRYFDQVIEKELSLAIRNQSSITLAIIDIDYFKKYNDYYGHPAGDQALIKIAQAFSQSLGRPNDYVFRLGGEEFAFIFSGTNTEQSLQFIESIRKKVEMLKIEHAQSDLSHYMTISIGAYISCTKEPLDSNELYIKADEALYTAKQQRNTAIIPNNVTC